MVFNVRVMALPLLTPQIGEQGALVVDLGAGFGAIRAWPLHPCGDASMCGMRVCPQRGGSLLEHAMFHCII